MTPTPTPLPRVTISGADFGSALPAVNWGPHPITAACSLTIQTDCIASHTNTSVVIAPPFGSGSAAVTVNGGAASAAMDDDYSYGPVVMGLKPQGGTTGTHVTISGAGFGTALPTVDWGGTTIVAKCTLLVTGNCIASHTDSSVVVVAPSGSGTVAVNVNGGVVSSITDNNFYYGPVVTKLSPQGGVATGGTHVTISGAAFGTALPAINWGSSHTIAVACTTSIKTDCVASHTNTSVVVVAPAGTGSVAVTVNGGHAVAQVDTSFYYGPVVTKLTPQGGLPGTRVAISGAAFGTVLPTVRWGSGHTITARCSSSLTTDCIASFSNSSVVVVAPDGSGSVAATINSGAVATNADNHFYYGPVVTGLAWK